MAVAIANANPGGHGSAKQLSLPRVRLLISGFGMIAEFAQTCCVLGDLLASLLFPQRSPFCIFPGAKPLGQPEASLDLFSLIPPAGHLEERGGRGAAGAGGWARPKATKPESMQCIHPFGLVLKEMSFHAPSGPLQFFGPLGSLRKGLVWFPENGAEGLDEETGQTESLCGPRHVRPLSRGLA